MPIGEIKILLREYEIEMAASMGFRVGVDAREMRQGIRSRFFMYVDLLRDRYVGDIEDRIRCFLCVDGPISLMIGNNYLPSAENVRLLCAGDVLKVVEQNRVCDNEKNDVTCICKNGDSGHDQICMKESKSMKKKRHISGDMNSNCDAVNEDVQTREVLPKNPNESAEYTKQKGKKRKKKSEDNVSCLSDELYVTEKSRYEEMLNGVQHTFEKKESKRRHGRNGNDVDMRLESDISSRATSVATGSVCVKTGPGSDSLVDGVTSSIETGSHAETVQDNESLLTTDANTKRRRKRTRRHKKDSASECSKTIESFAASVTNPKRETFIQNVAAPRTHIRFSDWDGDVNTETTVNAQVETHDGKSQMEFEPTCTSPVNVEVSSLQSSVISNNVDVVSSELNAKEDGKLNSLSLHEESTTNWDVQAADCLQSVDLCSGSSLNKSNFAKLLTFKNSSTPHVYQRKKNFITADTAVNGTTPETPSSTDVGNRGQIEVNKTSNMDLENSGQIKIDDEKTDFSQYPFLKDMPKEGDLIAFKMLKLGEDYTPQISDYITAQVVSAFKVTYELKLKIVDGNKEYQQPKGRFHLECDDSSEMDTFDDLMVNWNEMLETRLLYP